MFLSEDMDDQAMVDQMMACVRKIAAALVDEPNIAIMGFSRGGLAAFQWLARHPDKKDVKVIVSMDAAPQDLKASKDLIATILTIKKPFWAFYADYSDCPGDRTDRITNMHRAINATKVELTDEPPDDPPYQCMTELQTKGDAGERHNQVCTQVTRSSLVYDWILRQLRR